MRSVSSSPTSLRSEFTAWMSSYTRPSRSELVVEREIERDGDAVRRRDRPALLAVALDEHLVRAELVAGDAEPAAGELLELARLERGPHGRRARGRASGRARAGSASRAARSPPTSPNCTSFTRSSSAISSAWPSASLAPATTSARSGWRSFTPAVERAWRPSSTTRRSCCDLVEERRVVRRAGLGPAGEDAPTSGASRPARVEHPPEVLRQERHERRRRPAAPGRARTRASRSAASSPSQNRRRERRMYQFERSSTNASNARTTSTVSQLS